MPNSDDAFKACRELQQFAISNRPEQRPRTGSESIVLWTLARPDKTFRAILHLCDVSTGGGYGEQAGMLVRTLFEDMVTAHWTTRFPERAVKQITEQDRYVAIESGRVLKKYKLAKPGTKFLVVTSAEEARLRAHYARGGWTRKTVPQMVRAITPMWKDSIERRLLLQMHDIGHRVNNTITHHSARSLSRNVTMTDGGFTFNAGRTESYLEEALSMAFWTYVQTLSLSLEGDAADKLVALYLKHREVYSRVRPVAEPDELAAHVQE